MLYPGRWVVSARSNPLFPHTHRPLRLVARISRVLSLFLGLLLVLSATVYAQAPSALVSPPGGAGKPSFAAAPKQPEYAPDRVIVRFRADASKATQDEVHSKAGARLLRRFRAVPGLQVVQLPAGMSVSEALHRYRSDPNIAYAEPDQFLHALETVPNDPNFSSLWALKNTGQSGGTIGADIGATKAWDLSTGSNSVYVGVIDSGVDYNHLDLSSNIYSSPTDCNTNGVDDDADGYIDDCHGIDTVNHDSDPMDDNEHGTHVSGTIGAIGNNSVGVVGVNWRVTIIPCKFLDSSGSGPTSAAIECLDWFATLKDHGLNIIATNNSYGGGGFSQAFEDALKANLQRGILFVAAAGNSNASNDTAPDFPANYDLPNVVVVAATDRNDLRATFSNYGRWTVHLGAPGVGILSTVPADAYAPFDGTSMAAPHVTGAAALLKAQNPSLDWAAIKNLLMSSAEPIAALADKTISGGRLNVYGAMTCSSRPLYSPLRPYLSRITAVTGQPLTFAALNINCAQPAGEIAATIDGGAESVTLHDDGINGDLAAGDGVYSGQWTATTPGTHTYSFPGGSGGTILVLTPYGPPFQVSTPYRYTNGTNLMLSYWNRPQASLDLTAPGFFPVTFGGATFNNIVVGFNGVLTFQNLPFSISHYAAPIPTPNAQVLIAPWWDYLAPTNYAPPLGYQNVYYDVIGTAPNRELVIEWRDVSHLPTYWDDFDYPDLERTVRFEVVFFENTASTSDVLFNYADTYFDQFDNRGLLIPYNYGAEASVGIQTDPAHGVQYSYDQAKLGGGLSLLFQAGAGGLNVTAPNGGESWSLGSTHAIEWHYSGAVGTKVKVQLYKGGVLWSNLSTGLAVGANGTGSFAWSINPQLVTGSDYKIVVTSLTDPAVSDTSDANFSLTPVVAGISVVSPNGGEALPRGTTQTIQWNYWGDVGPTVNVQLFKGAVLWSNVRMGTPSGANGVGSFAWAIPTATPQSSDYKIRVSSASSAGINDSSDASFSLTEGPEDIRIISPNGGEAWKQGSTQTIQWIYTGGGDSPVKIQLFKAGIAWSNLSLAAPIGTGGLGSFAWTINSQLPAAFDYAIHITRSNGATDTSDSVFSLLPGPRITVSSPNGGESWAIGSTQTIQWSYAGDLGSTVDVQLYKGGVLWSNLARAVPVGAGGVGSFTWKINEVLSAASDYKIRVKSTTDATMSDISDAPFELSPPPPPRPTITLVAPNGGESWSLGSTHTIKWTYTGPDGDPALIELLKSGITWSLLALNVPIGSGGSGSFNWTISAVLPAGSDYKIRVNNNKYNYGEVFNQSDADFSLTAAANYVTLVSPNGGEAWALGATQTIQWNYAGVVGSAVKIELLKSGVLWSTLSTSVPVGSSGSGSFAWNINPALAVASDYRIRVTSTSNTAITDSSNANFNLH